MGFPQSPCKYPCSPKGSRELSSYWSKVVDDFFSPPLDRLAGSAWLDVGPQQHLALFPITHTHICVPHFAGTDTDISTAAGGSSNRPVWDKTERVIDENRPLGLRGKQFLAQSKDKGGQSVWGQEAISHQHATPLSFPTQTGTVWCYKAAQCPSLHQYKAQSCPLRTTRI